MSQNYVHISWGPAVVLAGALKDQRGKRTVEQAAERAKLPISRLVALEEGADLPTWEELGALCRAYRLDKHTRWWLSLKLSQAIEDRDYLEERAALAAEQAPPSSDQQTPPPGGQKE